jgi:hypothetical protein
VRELRVEQGEEGHGGESLKAAGRGQPRARPGVVQAWARIAALSRF